MKVEIQGREQLESLFQFLEHGPAAHRTWLWSAMVAWAVGEDRPPTDASVIDEG